MNELRISTLVVPVTLGNFRQWIGLFMLLLATNISGEARADEAAPWRSCVSGINYDAPGASATELRVFDRFGRDISRAGIPIMDWEGFVENPQFIMSLRPPASVVYPVTLRVTAPGTPRLYIFERHVGEDPYDIRNNLSVHNENGPLWGVNLTTVNDGTWVFGGVSHDLTDQELADIGLNRQIRNFFDSDFPLALHVGIHPDREDGDETYTLIIEMNDAASNSFRRELPVVVCDQDRPERPTDFKFHVDYSYDWDGYLEDTTDGQVIKAGHERILDDLAYFFTDMRFDEVPVGACEVFLNWSVPDRPGTGTNNWAYDRGHYVFINSHSGGGGLNSDLMHTRNGVATDFPACSFWGANRRHELSVNVNTRIYVPEDDWWRTVSEIYGENGDCLGDELGDPGNGCIECPDGQDWCVHLRHDIYWPNLHELNHGLTMATGWPRWARWFWSDEGCIDDPTLMVYAGTCLPVYRTDHVVLLGETFESNKPSDWGRTLFKKYDFLLMQAVGWELRDTTMLTDLTIGTDTLAAGNVAASYSDTIEVYGGVPSYSFTLKAGSLPLGISLNTFNGKLTGQPASAGTFNFTIRVFDSGEYNVLRHGGVDQAFTLVINE